MAKSNLNAKKLMKMLSLNKLQKKLMFLMKPKNLYKVLILLVILGILYFIRQHFLAKEGFASTAEEFEEEIAGGKALVLFHADWCGHCKKFMPQWDAMSKEINDSESGVKLVKVECGDASNNEKHAEIMKKYSIKGYPTILSFDEAGNHSEYEGDRSKEGITQFLGL
jgi:protein disulfide-isomerase-like protein